MKLSWLKEKIFGKPILNKEGKFIDYAGFFALRRILLACGVETREFNNESGNPYPAKIESWLLRIAREQEIKSRKTKPRS